MNDIVKMVNNGELELYTVSMTARLLGKSRSGIKYLFKNRMIKGVKVGGVWITDKSNIKKYEEGSK